MAEFFKWISVNPVAAIIFSLVYPICVSIIVVGLLQRREVEVEAIIPPKFRLKPKALMVQIGDIDYPNTDKAHELYSNYKGEVGVDVPVTFDPPFEKYVKKITVSLREIDADVGANVRLRVKVVKQDLKGFEARFERWEDSKVWHAAATWIAVGE
jgi:hypothetical protein